MNHQQEEALEAAKLAAMVGSQLRAVDQMTVERHSTPANRIDINKFVAQVKGQPTNQNMYQPNNFGVKSPYLSEDEVQRLAPEPPRFVPPTTQELASQMIPIPQATLAAPVNTSPNIVASLPTITNDVSSSIKNIEESLEKIGNSLNSLLELVHNKLNQNE